MSFSSLTLGLAMVLFGMAATGIAAPRRPRDDNDARAARFIAEHEKSIEPLEVDVAHAWWDANVSGKEEQYRHKQEMETRLDLKLADRGRFAELKAIHDQPIRDPLLARQIAVLYLQYLPRQLEPALLKQMLAVSNKVEKTFNTFRARVDGHELSDSEVRSLLHKSKDSSERKAVWEASKEVGRRVDADLRWLVKLRNEAAHKLGFKDYHVMQLYLGEQSQEQVLSVLDELEALTRDQFHAAKAEIDVELAKNCGIAVEELRPWHYHDPFFQESPQVFGSPSDKLYAEVDIPKVCRAYYAGIGLPVDDVVARSDLYEKPGKNPHAFCTDLDRKGDVRVLANIVPNQQWLATLLHELGHSVYSSKNMPASLPYVLRTDAHALSTEAVAMMFEGFVSDSGWLKKMGIDVPDPAAFDRTATKLRRNHRLIFSRWCQVMFRFEKELYANPDQDLQKVWWDLVEKYQELRRPDGREAADYASKIHVVSAPAYYHNYMLGELFASQMRHTIAREVLGGAAPSEAALYVGNRGVGDYMRKRVFEKGRTLDWNGLSKEATGEPLNPRAFAADLQGK